MKNKDSFITNLIHNYSSIALSNLIAALTTMYVTRVLGPDNLGKVTFGKSCIAYFSFFMGPGLMLYAIKRVAETRDAKERTEKLFGELLSTNLLMIFFTTVIFVVCLMVIPQFRSEKYVFILLFCEAILNNLACDWLYKGMEDFQFVAWREVIAHAACLILVLLFVNGRSDYLGYVWAMFLAFSAVYIFSLVHSQKYVSRIRMSVSGGITHFKPMLPFMLMTVSGTIYANMDSVMLGFLLNMSISGYYGIATSVKNVLSIVGIILYTTAMPASTRVWNAGDVFEFVKLKKRLLKYVVYLIVPLFILSEVSAPLLVHVLAGKEFAISITPLRVLLLTLIPMGFSNIYGGVVLIPSGNEKKLLICQATGAIVNLILNVPFILLWGMVGAAASTVVAEIIVWIMTAFYSTRVCRE